MSSAIDIFIFSYLFVINIVSFLVYKADKRRAQYHKWRIKEHTLIILTVIGGAFGAFLATRFYRHKTKHKLFSFVILIAFVPALFLTSLPIVSNYVIYAGSQDLVSENEIESAQAVIVLGSLVYDSGEIGSMLKDRLDEGYYIYSKQKAEKILLCGDNNEGKNRETSAMRDYILSLGVPVADILVDNYGYDTLNSIRHAKDKFKISNGIVVSQRLHVIRALYIAKDDGLKYFGVACDSQKTYKSQIFYEIREYFARYKAFIECLGN